jgi:hypothetical protein
MTKRLCATILVSVFMLMLVAAPLPAETGIVKYQGPTAMLPYSLQEDIYVNGGPQPFGTWYTGMIPMWLNGNPAAVPPYSDGTPIEAYCVDIYNAFDWQHAYGVTIVPLPATTPWQEIAYILDRNPLAGAPNTKSLGAALQVAIWKLVYGSGVSPINITVLRKGANPAFPTPLSLTEENLALALIAQAGGKRLLSCGSDGAVQFTLESFWDPATPAVLKLVVTAKQDGQPAVGQPVALTASSGTFISPADGKGLIDGTGTLVAMLNLDPAAVETTVVAEAWGRTIYTLDPGPDSTRQFLIFSRPCKCVAETSFKPAPPCGDPHTIGFWKHQVSVALTGRGAAQVPAPILQSYLPLTTLGGVQVTSLQQMYDMLWLKNATMAQRAQQQYLATLLNVKNGQLSLLSLVDINYDGIPDVPLNQAFAMALAAWNAHDYETAKSICDSINNMGPAD